MAHSPEYLRNKLLRRNSGSILVLCVPLRYALNPPPQPQANPADRGGGKQHRREGQIATGCCVLGHMLVYVHHRLPTSARTGEWGEGSPVDLDALLLGVAIGARTERGTSAGPGGVPAIVLECHQARLHQIFHYAVWAAPLSPHRRDSETAARHSDSAGGGFVVRPAVSVASRMRRAGPETSQRAVKRCPAALTQKTWESRLRAAHGAARAPGASQV
ncbi:hypothetical protein AURDEDRAFT_176088 [Auricularia subglabra TFB-10046 SS5]|nr:hypothetical protein AURDEDRAFT_176088 [Auricularia subglabra TFB-10046 SS5]